MCLMRVVFMALCAKFKFQPGVFSLTLRRKTRKNTPVSKEYSAAAGGDILFTQPHNPRIIWREAP